MKEVLKTWLKLLLGRGVGRTYSQFGEDAVIAALFRHRRTGIYVDIGAYHPTLYSNTYALYKKGWHGIAIDPNPALAPLFRAVRPRDLYISMAIDSEGEKTYFQYKDGAYNSMSSSQAETLRKRGLIPEHEIKIPAAPLSKVLGAHAIRRIDFMNIDVEGMDLQVLKTHDWNLPPEVIAIEDENFNPDSPHTSPVYSFLKERGYTLEG